MAPETLDFRAVIAIHSCSLLRAFGTRKSSVTHVPARAAIDGANCPSRGRPGPNPEHRLHWLPSVL